MRSQAKALWRGLRQWSGDDAYERYLQHHAQHHAEDGAPLGRAEFFKRWQDGLWQGVRRCC